MRYTVRSIDIAGARNALALDALKTPEAIRAIVERRGMEAEAALDAAMVRADFDKPEDAQAYGARLAENPEIFEVSGLVFDGANLVEAFGWEGN
jgi:hypothetical protein